jgi:hypothetical protein
MPAEAAPAERPTISELQHQVAELSDRLRVQGEEHDEALRREAAITEILGVINDPAADLSRVFAVILERATRLCDAAFGIPLAQRQ